MEQYRIEFKSGTLQIFAGENPRCLASYDMPAYSENKIKRFSDVLAACLSHGISPAGSVNLLPDLTPKIVYSNEKEFQAMLKQLSAGIDPRKRKSDKQTPFDKKFAAIEAQYEKEKAGRLESNYSKDRLYSGRSNDHLYGHGPSITGHYTPERYVDEYESSKKVARDERKADKYASSKTSRVKILTRSELDDLKFDPENDSDRSI